MRQRVSRGLTRTIKVPCAESTTREPLRLDDGVDPGKGGWQLLFKGYGDGVRFNALPLTFLTGGKLVAQVIAIRAEGLDWWGMFVPEPAPATPEEADARFGADAMVGAVMRQIAEASSVVVLKSRSVGATTLERARDLAKVASAAPMRLNRAERRKHAAEVRKAPAKRAG